MLISKDDELRRELDHARQQETIQSKINALIDEVQKHDAELKLLQKKYKEAEYVLVRLCEFVEEILLILFP